MTEADDKVNFVYTVVTFLFIDIVLIAIHSDFFFDATILVAPKDRPERNTPLLIVDFVSIFPGSSLESKLKTQANNN